MDSDDAMILTSSISGLLVFVYFFIRCITHYHFRLVLDNDDDYEMLEEKEGL